MPDMENEEFVHYHALECEKCGSDLTTPHAVRVEFVDERGHSWDVTSELASDGQLADHTGDIEHGLHSGSYCRDCGEQLEDLFEPISASDADRSDGDDVSSATPPAGPSGGSTGTKGPRLDAQTIVALVVMVVMVIAFGIAWLHFL